jgi:vacuolar-type H+-ATPase subunit B/Vma2
VVLTQVARAVAKVREVLKDVAFAGKTAKSTRDRSVVASAVNFEAAWAVLSPVRIGRASVVTKEQLQKCGD